MNAAVAIAAVRNRSCTPRSGEVASHHGVRLRVRLLEVAGVDLGFTHRLVGRFAGQHGPVSVGGVDRDRGGESHPERRLGEVAVVDLDSHGHTLHHLDPVAGGVLGGQQGERRPGARGHAAHMAMENERAAIQIAAYLRRLSNAHVAQLHFLEVRIHPQSVQRNHRHERLAGLDVLAQLHAALGHVTAHGRDHGVAPGGDPRVAKCGLGLEHRGVVLDRIAVHQRVRGPRLADRFRERGLGQFDRFARMTHLLRRDRAVGHQRFALLEVDQGTPEFDLARRHGGVVLPRGRFLLAHLTHRLGESARGVRETDLRIHRIETHQHVARVHELGIIGEHRDHRA